MYHLRIPWKARVWADWEIEGEDKVDKPLRVRIRVEHQSIHEKNCHWTGPKVQRLVQNRQGSQGPVLSKRSLKRTWSRYQETNQQSVNLDWNVGQSLENEM